MENQDESRIGQTLCSHEWFCSLHLDFTLVESPVKVPELLHAGNILFHDSIVSLLWYLDQHVEIYAPCKHQI